MAGLDSYTVAQLDELAGDDDGYPTSARKADKVAYLQARDGDDQGDPEPAPAPEPVGDPARRPDGTVYATPGIIDARERDRQREQARRQRERGAQPSPFVSPALRRQAEATAAREAEAGRSVIDRALGGREG